MTTSTIALIAANSAESSEAFLTLIEISPPGAAALRFVNNLAPVTHQGQVYQAWAFTVRWPDKRESGLPQVALVIDDVARAASQAIRAADAPIPMVLKMVLASTPDIVEYGPVEAELTQARIDGKDVEAQVTVSTVLDESVCKDLFSPGLFPGLF